MTSTSSSCAIINSSTCYFRVRAELNDDSISSYSACLQISNQFNENRGTIYGTINSTLHVCIILIIIVTNKNFQDVCFQVRGICLDGYTPSRFRIDGEPLNTNDYNVSYVRGSGFVFCLKNLSRMVVVTELCEFIAQNDFCLPGVIVQTFLSRTEVYLLNQEFQTSTTECII